MSQTLDSIHLRLNREHDMPDDVDVDVAADMDVDMAINMTLTNHIFLGQYQMAQIFLAY
jgi:hypothetical protein